MDQTHETRTTPQSCVWVLAASMGQGRGVLQHLIGIVDMFGPVLAFETIAETMRGLTHGSAEHAVRHFGRCLPLKTPPPPLKLESIFLGIFCSFEFSRYRHCHGTRKCPHRLSSDKLLRVAVRIQWQALQECVEIMATLHNTQHRTRTHQPQQLAHKERNAPQPITHQPQHEEGRDGVLRGARVQAARLTACASCRFHAVGHSLKRTCQRGPGKARPNRRSGLSRHRQVWSALGSASSASRVRSRSPSASAGGGHRPWGKCKR